MTDKKKTYQLKCDIGIYAVYKNNQKSLPFQIKGLPIKRGLDFNLVMDSWLEFIEKVL